MISVYSNCIPLIVHQPIKYIENNEQEVITFCEMLLNKDKRTCIKAQYINSINEGCEILLVPLFLINAEIVDLFSSKYSIKVSQKELYSSWLTLVKDAVHTVTKCCKVSNIIKVASIIPNLSNDNEYNKVILNIISKFSDVLILKVIQYLVEETTKTILLLESISIQGELWISLYYYPKSNLDQCLFLLKEHKKSISVVLLEDINDKVKANKFITTLKKLSTIKVGACLFNANQIQNFYNSLDIMVINTENINYVSQLKKNRISIAKNTILIQYYCEPKLDLRYYFAINNKNVFVHFGVRADEVIQCCMKLSHINILPKIRDEYPQGIVETVFCGKSIRFYFLNRIFSLKEEMSVICSIIRLYEKLSNHGLIHGRVHLDNIHIKSNVINEASVNLGLRITAIDKIRYLPHLSLSDDKMKISIDIICIYLYKYGYVPNDIENQLIKCLNQTKYNVIIDFLNRYKCLIDHSYSSYHRGNDTNLIDDYLKFFFKRIKKYILYKVYD